MARLTDKHIAERIAWLSGRDEGGRIPVAMGGLTPIERSELSNLIELQQHRARIAAHATAHPERLSDDVVNAMAGVSFVPGIGPVTPQESVMALEIQQRRAADLTPLQIEALKFAAGAIDFYGSSLGCSASSEEIQTMRDAIALIIRSQGASP